MATITLSATRDNGTPLSATISGLQDSDIATLLLAYQTLLQLGYSTDGTGKQTFTQPADAVVWKALSGSIMNGVAANIASFVKQQKTEAANLDVQMPVLTIS